MKTRSIDGIVEISPNPTRGSAEGTALEHAKFVQLTFRDQYRPVEVVECAEFTIKEGVVMFWADYDTGPASKIIRVLMYMVPVDLIQYAEQL